MLASLTSSHLHLARQTSSRIGIYATVHTLVYAWVCLAATIQMAITGPTAGLVVASVVGALAVLLPIACCAHANRRTAEQLLRAASFLLNAQVRHPSTHVSSTALDGARAMMTTAPTRASSSRTVRGTRHSASSASRRQRAASVERLACGPSFKGVRGDATAGQRGR